LRRSSILVALHVPSPIFAFFFSCAGAHLVLHSFPTRRSSDLVRSPFLNCGLGRVRLVPAASSLLLLPSLESSDDGFFSCRDRSGSGRRGVGRVVVGWCSDRVR